MMALVQAKNLSKIYDQREVVRGIDFNVSAGRCFGFLGPNGAGKTTTLRMILGLTPPDGGSLSVFDKSMPEAAAEVRRRVGVVPQLDNLDPDFTVAENLKVYGSYFRLPARELGPRIDELLRFVELRERRNARIQTLSGGMQRRLTIARALINDPELIVLDEPTTGLDPQARHLIWGRLRELLNMGKTLLLTTHYMEEAERLCDELVIMEEGHIITSGSPSLLVRQHVPPEVVEVRHGVASARLALQDCPHCTVEQAGDTLYCHTINARPVVEILESIPDVIFLQRPANLEDVFLRLTGRELHE